MNIGNIKYIQIPGQPHSSDCPPELYEKVLRDWAAFWSSEYTNYGSHEHLDHMDFYRQNLFTVVMDGEQTVATHGLTFFDLRYDYSQFSYFRQMHKPATLERLKAEGKNRIVVQQYLMVNPEFSVRNTGVNWSAVIAALSLRNHEGYDGTLTAARTEVAAGSLAKKLGFNQISEPHLVHNVPVVSFFCSVATPYRRQIENDFIDALWANRINYSNTLGAKNEGQYNLRSARQSPIGDGGEVSV